MLRDVCEADEHITVRYGMHAQVEWPAGSAAEAARSGGTRVTLAPTECVASAGSHDESEGEGAQVATEVFEPFLLVGADGVGSAVRDAMEREGVVKHTRFEDTNVRRYKTIPLHPDLASDPSQWRKDLNLSARSRGGGGKDQIVLEVLPTAEGVGVGVALFKPGNTAIADADTADGAEALFNEHFPHFKEVIPPGAYARFAAQPEQKLPTFSYVAPRLHARGTVLVGDSIKYACAPPRACA